MRAEHSWWIAPGGGAWGDPANWSNGVPDAPGDSSGIVASAGQQFTVTLDPSIYFGSAWMDAPAVTLHAPSGPEVSGGTIELRNGTLRLDTDLHLGSFSFEGGSIVGPGLVVLRGGVLNNFSSDANGSFVLTSTGAGIVRGGIPRQQTVTLMANMAGGIGRFDLGWDSPAVDGTLVLAATPDSGGVQIEMPLTINGNLLVSSGPAPTANGPVWQQIKNALTNNAPATARFEADTSIDEVTNFGNFAVAAGKTLRVPFDFRQESGTLELDGELHVGWAFHNDGGTITGPGSVVLHGGLLVNNTADATGRFTFRTSNTVQTLSQHRIPARQTIVLEPANDAPDGHGLSAYLSYDGDTFVNDGTLVLSSRNGAYSSGIGFYASSGQSFTNNGTLRVQPGAGGQRLIRATFTNSAAAKAAFDADTVIDAVSFTNRGAMTIGPAVTVTFKGDPVYDPRTFTHAAGTLDLQGDLIIEDSSKFIFDGGTITGPGRVLLDNATLVNNNPAAPATFHLTNTARFGVPRLDYPAGAVSIGPEQTVIFRGGPADSAGASVTLGRAFVNDGTFSVQPHRPDGIAFVMPYPGPTFGYSFTNNGVFTTLPSPQGLGKVQFDAGLVNSAGGTLAIGTDTFVPGLINHGAILVAAGANLAAGRGVTPFMQESGTLTIDGSVSISGAFYLNGGKILGDGAMLVYGATIHNNDPEAGGSFIFRRNSLLNSRVFVGQTVTVEANATGPIVGGPDVRLSLPSSAPFINDGVVTLTARDGPHTSTLGAGDFTNNATFRSLPGSGGGRIVEARFTNTPTGSVRLEATTSFVETLNNAGELTLADGVTLRSSKLLRNAGTLTVAATASIDLRQGAMIEQATDAASRDAALSHITSLIRSARNAAGGLWTGSGITSSDIAPGVTTLAAVPNVGDDGSPLITNFGGQAVDANSVLVMFTREGDADLDGRITAGDFFLIDRGHSRRGLFTPATPAGYRDGNVDYDFDVDADDYALVDRSFLSPAAALSSHSPHPAAWSASPVPEPSSTLLVLAAVGLLWHRRCRTSRCSPRG
jgi:hypothetical protein